MSVETTPPLKKGSWEMRGERASPSFLPALLLLGVTLLAGFLRFYKIDSQPVWLDEAFSIWLSSHSVPDVIRWVIDIDQHPPIYYLFLHFWMYLGGTGAFWVRSLSALAGILTIPTIYMLGKTLGDRTVGLIAALIFAVNPFQVSYGQEARTYALITLSVSLSLWMTARLLTDRNASRQSLGDQLELAFKTIRQVRIRPSDQASTTLSHTDVSPQNGIGYQGDFRTEQNWIQTRTRRSWLSLVFSAPAQMKTDLTWAGYIVFTALVIYQHNTAVFYPLGVNLFVLGFILWRRFFHAPDSQFQPPSFKNWFWAQVGVGLLWSPWIVAFIAQAQGIYGDFWISKPTWQTVVDTIKAFFNDYMPGRLAGDRLSASLIWNYFAAIAMLGIVSFRRGLGRALLLLVVFLTPLLGELLVSIWRPIFYVRTLIWAPLPVYILMAAGIRQLRFRPFILAALAVLVAINGFSLNEYYNHRQKEAWNQVADYLARNVTSEDILIFNAGWTQLPFDYYFNSYKIPVEEYGAPATLFEWGVLEPRMTEADVPRLRTILQGRQRVWLIYSHNWWTDPESLIIRTLQEEFRQVRRSNFVGVEVYLFEVR